MIGMAGAHRRRARALQERLGDRLQAVDGAPPGSPARITALEALTAAADELAAQEIRHRLRRSDRDRRRDIALVLLVCAPAAAGVVTLGLLIHHGSVGPGWWPAVAGWGLLLAALAGTAVRPGTEDPSELLVPAAFVLPGTLALAPGAWWLGWWTLVPQLVYWAWCGFLTAVSADHAAGQV